MHIQDSSNLRPKPSNNQSSGSQLSVFGGIFAVPSDHHPEPNTRADQSALVAIALLAVVIGATWIRSIETRHDHPTTPVVQARLVAPQTISKEEALVNELSDKACKGDLEANLRLGEILFFGNGVKRNVPLAYANARYATDNMNGGNEYLARSLVAMIAQNMSYEQRAAGDRLRHSAMPFCLSDR